jgi:enamine deaminase RidA (YjgF/YER057c/UK114 family)
MRRMIWTLMSLLIVGAAHARQAPTREHLAPKGWEWSYHEYHYSPVVKIGDRVIVSGIPAMRGETQEDKIRWAFEQLKAHLETAGASLDDVVELRSFHVTDSHDDFRVRFEIVEKVAHEFFKDRYPAWTAVGTTALLAKDAPMELSAEAIIGSGRDAKVAIPRLEK